MSKTKTYKLKGLYKGDIWKYDEVELGDDFDFAYELYKQYKTGTLFDKPRFIRVTTTIKEEILEE